MITELGKDINIDLWDNLWNNLWNTEIGKNISNENFTIIRNDIVDDLWCVLNKELNKELSKNTWDKLCDDLWLCLNLKNNLLFNLRKNYDNRTR